MLNTPLILIVLTAIVPSGAFCGPISSCDSLAGNLLQNCGFELGALSGWTESGNVGNAFAFSNFGGFLPNSGEYFAAAGPVGSEGMLSQTFPTTPGDFYTIAWYLASDGSIPNNFNVIWDGNTIFAQSDIQVPDFVQYSFVELATSLSTTLTFGFRSDPGYLAFDDASVTSNATAEVPEPSTVVLLGIGLLAWILAHTLCRQRC